MPPGLTTTPPSPTARDTQRFTFLAKAGWGEALCEARPGDASFRHYFRLKRGQQSAMLMDAPPEKEAVLPFIQVAQHLQAIGLSAPSILYEDREQGFLLLEDFGDNTFTHLLTKGQEEETLYQLALNCLITLQQNPTATALPLAAYDEATFLREAALFAEWYYPAKTGAPCPAPLQESWRGLWREIFAGLPKVPQTLVLRDYHVDNLMLLSGRKGVKACGLLDFQDALRGPVVYDLLSLLEDARRDLSPDLQKAMLVRYFAAFPELDHNAFQTVYGVWAAQRHAKVAGIFVRLYERDDKSGYLKHLPRVLRLLSLHLEEPALAPLAAWLDTHLPDFASTPFPSKS